MDCIDFITHNSVSNVHSGQSNYPVSISNASLQRAEKLKGKEIKINMKYIWWLWGAKCNTENTTLKKSQDLTTKEKQQHDFKRHDEKTITFQITEKVCNPSIHQQIPYITSKQASIATDALADKTSFTNDRIFAFLHKCSINKKIYIKT